MTERKPFRMEQSSKERHPGVQNVLNTFIADEARRNALIQGGDSPAAQNVKSLLRESLTYLAPLQRDQLAQTLVYEQTRPITSPEIAGAQTGARALLAHLDLKGSTRYAAAEAFETAVSSIGEDTPIETLKALEKTATTLLASYNPRARVTPDEIMLGRSAWEVIKRVYSTQDEPSEPANVVDERTTVGRLAGVGFRTSLITKVSGISPIIVADELRKLREEPTSEPEAEELPGETVYDPQVGVVPEEVAPLEQTVHEAIGGEVPLSDVVDSGEDFLREEEPRKMRKDYMPPEVLASRIALIREMLESGATIDEVSKEFRISTETVRLHINRASELERDAARYLGELTESNDVFERYGVEETTEQEEPTQESLQRQTPPEIEE